MKPIIDTNDDPMQLRGSCEDPRLTGAGYIVCGSACDTEWHWRAPGGPWHDGFKSEYSAVRAALRALRSDTNVGGDDANG